MQVTPVDATVQEIARNSEALFFKRVSGCGVGVKLAEFLELSEPTISNFKSPEKAINVSSVCKMLAFLGLQIVPTDSRMVDRDEYRALITMAHMTTSKLKNSIDGEP